MGAEFHGLLDEHAEGLRKPLYLQGQNGLAVELDGPALRALMPRSTRQTMYAPARIKMGGSTYTSQFNPVRGGSPSTRSPYWRTK